MSFYVNYRTIPAGKGACGTFLSHEDTLDLIEAVRKQENLWNEYDENYNFSGPVRVSWNNIIDELFEKGCQDADLAIDTWSHLYTAYYKNLRTPVELSANDQEYLNKMSKFITGETHPEDCYLEITKREFIDFPAIRKHYLYEKNQSVPNENPTMPTYKRDYGYPMFGNPLARTGMMPYFPGGFAGYGAMPPMYQTAPQDLSNIVYPRFPTLAPSSYDQFNMLLPAKHELLEQAYELQKRTNVSFTEKVGKIMALTIENLENSKKGGALCDPDMRRNLSTMSTLIYKKNNDISERICAYIIRITKPDFNPEEEKRVLLQLEKEANDVEKHIDIFKKMGESTAAATKEKNSTCSTRSGNESSSAPIPNVATQSTADLIKQSSAEALPKTEQFLIPVAQAFKKELKKPAAVPVKPADSEVLVRSVTTPVVPVLNSDTVVAVDANIVVVSQLENQNTGKCFEKTGLAPKKHQPTNEEKVALDKFVKEVLELVTELKKQHKPKEFIKKALEEFQQQKKEQAEEEKKKVAKAEEKFAEEHNRKMEENRKKESQKSKDWTEETEKKAQWRRAYVENSPKGSVDGPNPNKRNKKEAEKTLKMESVEQSTITAAEQVGLKSNKVRWSTGPQKKITVAKKAEEKATVETRSIFEFLKTKSGEAKNTGNQDETASPDIRPEQSSYSWNPCNICDKVFLTDSSLRNHMENMHVPEEKKVQELPKTPKYETYEQLGNRCDICFEKIDTYFALAGHKKNKHGIMPNGYEENKTAKKVSGIVQAINGGTTDICEQFVTADQLAEIDAATLLKNFEDPSVALHKLDLASNTVDQSRQFVEIAKLQEDIEPKDALTPTPNEETAPETLEALHKAAQTTADAPVAPARKVDFETAPKDATTNKIHEADTSTLTNKKQLTFEDIKKNLIEMQKRREQERANNKKEVINKTASAPSKQDISQNEAVEAPEEKKAETMETTVSDVRNTQDDVIYTYEYIIINLLAVLLVVFLYLGLH